MRNLRVQDGDAVSQSAVIEVGPAELLPAGLGPQDVTADGPRPLGKIVTVFSAKGGTGKTVVSTNLAVALHAGGARRGCIVDLDLEFGDVAITLGLAPNRGIIDAVSFDLATCSDTEFDTLFTTVRPGLDCILGPVNPGDAEQVSPAVVAELLQQLRRRYDYVLVDTPSQLSEHVLEALDASDYHVLITTPEIPSLKNLRLTLDMLDLLAYSQQSRFIVLNRADPRVGLSAEDAESAILTPLAARIPASHEVTAAINSGVPITISRPNHPVSTAIQQFANDNFGQAPVTAVRPAGRFGLKSRMRSI